MLFSDLDINRQLELSPFARRRVTERQLVRFPHDAQQSLVKRGMATRSWEELEAILDELR